MLRWGESAVPARRREHLHELIGTSNRVERLAVLLLVLGEHEAIVERVQWWAELFEPPCVGFAAALGEVGMLAGAGADFVLLGDAVWSDPRGATAALTDATAAIAKAMTAAVAERQT